MSCIVYVTVVIISCSIIIWLNNILFTYLPFAQCRCRQKHPNNNSRNKAKPFTNLYEGKTNDINKTKQKCHDVFSRRTFYVDFFYSLFFGNDYRNATCFFFFLFVVSLLDAVNIWLRTCETATIFCHLLLLPLRRLSLFVLSGSRWSIFKSFSTKTTVFFLLLFSFAFLFSVVLD